MVGLRGNGRSDYTPYLGIPERRRRLYPYSILPLQSPYTATLVLSYTLLVLLIIQLQLSYSYSLCS
jgi:hypothetical protein